MLKRNNKSLILFGTLVAAGVLLDLLSKWAVFTALNYDWEMARGETWVIIPRLLVFECHENPGVAFSLFSNMPPLVHLLVATVIIGVLIYMYRAGPSWAEKQREEAGGGLPWTRWHDVAIGLILAGAIGNVYDRLVIGKVRDFIRVYLPVYGPWPTFNLADTYITIGVLLYVALVLADAIMARRAARSGVTEEAAGERKP